MRHFESKAFCLSEIDYHWLLYWQWLQTGTQGGSTGQSWVIWLHVFKKTWSFLGQTEMAVNNLWNTPVVCRFWLRWWRGLVFAALTQPFWPTWSDLDLKVPGPHEVSLGQVDFLRLNGSRNGWLSRWRHVNSFELLPGTSLSSTPRESKSHKQALLIKTRLLILAGNIMICCWFLAEYRITSLTLYWIGLWKWYIVLKELHRSESKLSGVRYSLPPRPTSTPRQLRWRCLVFFAFTDVTLSRIRF